MLGTGSHVHGRVALNAIVPREVTLPRGIQRDPILPSDHTLRLERTSLGLESGSEDSSQNFVPEQL